MNEQTPSDTSSGKESKAVKTTVSPEIKQQADAIAAEDGVSTAAYVRELITDDIDARTGPTALTNVDWQEYRKIAEDLDNLGNLAESVRTTTDLPWPLYSDDIPFENIERLNTPAMRLPLLRGILEAQSSYKRVSDDFVKFVLGEQFELSASSVSRYRSKMIEEGVAYPLPNATSEWPAAQVYSDFIDYFERKTGKSRSRLEDYYVSPVKFFDDESVYPSTKSEWMLDRGEYLDWLINVTERLKGPEDDFLINGSKYEILHEYWIEWMNETGVKEMFLRENLSRSGIDSSKSTYRDGQLHPPEIEFPN